MRVTIAGLIGYAAVVYVLFSFTRLGWLDALFLAVIPARPRSDELELYAMGRDDAERVVARAGSPLSPLVLPVSLPEDAPLVEQWWLWTAVGGGIALAVVLGVALGVSSGQAAPSGTLPPGRVELP